MAFKFKSYPKFDKNYRYLCEGVFQHDGIQNNIAVELHYSVIWANAFEPPTDGP